MNQNKFEISPRLSNLLTNMVYVICDKDADETDKKFNLKFIHSLGYDRIIKTFGLGQNMMNELNGIFKEAGLTLLTTDGLGTQVHYINLN